MTMQILQVALWCASHKLETKVRRGRLLRLAKLTRSITRRKGLDAWQGPAGGSDRLAFSLVYTGLRKGLELSKGFQVSVSLLAAPLGQELLEL